MTPLARSSSPHEGPELCFVASGMLGEGLFLLCPHSSYLLSLGIDRVKSAEYIAILEKTGEWDNGVF
jgi:hypothetical protein